MQQKVVLGAVRLVFFGAVLLGSAACAGPAATAIVRETVNSVLRGDVDHTMTRVGVPFASDRGTVDTAGELRAALEFEIPRIAHHGYQILSISPLDATQIPSGHSNWSEPIAEHPNHSPILIVLRNAEGREMRYLALVSHEGKVEGFFD